MDQVEDAPPVGIEDIEVEPEVIPGIDAAAVEADAIEGLVFLPGLLEAIGLCHAVKGLWLIERQPVGIDARLVRGGPELEIEARPPPGTTVGDDADDREAEETDRRRDIRMTRAVIANHQDRGPRPRDLLDQHDRIAEGALAARREQPGTAELVAERQAAGHPGLGMQATAPEADDHHAGELPRQRKGSVCRAWSHGTKADSPGTTGRDANLALRDAGAGPADRVLRRRRARDCGAPALVRSRASAPSTCPRRKQSGSSARAGSTSRPARSSGPCAGTREAHRGWLLAGLSRSARGVSLSWEPHAAQPKIQTWPSMPAAGKRLVCLAADAAPPRCPQALGVHPWIAKLPIDFDIPRLIADIGMRPPVRCRRERVPRQVSSRRARPAPSAVGARPGQSPDGGRGT